MLRHTLLSSIKYYQYLNRCTYSIYNRNQSKSFLILIQNKQTFANMSTSSGNNSVFYKDVVNAIKNNQIYIIDVRKPEELQETGKIPNSINIPLNNLESILTNYTNDEFQEIYGRPKPTHQTEIIFTCQSGKRAGIAAVQALKLGFEKSRVYDGSWLDWSKHVEG